MFSTIRKSLQQCLQIKRGLHRFTYEPLTENRYEEVLVHLRDTTYHDIPFYKAAGLIGAGRAPEELDNYFLQSMKEGISMIALKEGKLAGVLINGVLTPDVLSDAVVNMNKVTKESYKKVYFMLLKLLLELDIFERFGISRVMEWRLVSTKREYRQSGLGKTLIGRLNQMARDLDCPMIVSEVTNKFLWNSRVLDDWILLRKMPYSDYIDEATGKSLYKVDPPHDVLHMCARIIDNRCKSKDPLPLPNSKMYYPIKMDL